MGGAIKLRDLIFVLERMTSEARKRLAPNNDSDTWVIAGFHNQSHYSFISVKASCQKQLNNI